jgi:hypothetical protein
LSFSGSLNLEALLIFGRLQAKVIDWCDSDIDKLKEDSSTDTLTKYKLNNWTINWLKKGTIKKKTKKWENS